MSQIAIALAAGLCVAVLSGPAHAVPKHEQPIPAATLALMAAKGLSSSAPILMRSYKKEAEIEVWKRARDGRYVHLKTFPVCRWSGQLGPKLRTGDRQTPEGFYSVAPKQMNPNSSYHLSFNLGYPNAYDRAHGGSGSHLMVHGNCSSAGCFAMTDPAVGELYALAREAFAGGQAAFQFQSFPFRMTAAQMARHRADPHIGFWRQLKEGFDRFEATGEEPVVKVVDGRYTFAPSKDPAREALATARRQEEETRVAQLVADGSASVRTTYSDGGQHAVFASLMRRGVPLGEVSRPEALALAGREIILTPARPKRIEVAAKPTTPPPVLGLAQFQPATAFASAVEPSLFAVARLGYEADRPVVAGPVMAGAGSPVSAQLAPSRFEIAARS
jgi:murein L,D-transpeptidase YafK